MAGVLLAEDGLLQRDAPVNAERLIKDTDAGISLRMIELVALVLEDSDIREHREAVREALRDEELAMIVFRKLHSHMPAISGTAPPDVHSHVKHSSTHAANQLGLGERRHLEMQPAHHPTARTALVVLHEPQLPHLGVELPL